MRRWTFRTTRAYRLRKSSRSERRSRWPARSVARRRSNATDSVPVGLPRPGESHATPRIRNNVFAQFAGPARGDRNTGLDVSTSLKKARRHRNGQTAYQQQSLLPLSDDCGRRYILQLENRLREIESRGSDHHSTPVPPAGQRAAAHSFSPSPSNEATTVALQTAGSTIALEPTSGLLTPHTTEQSLNFDSTAQSYVRGGPRRAEARLPSERVIGCRAVPPAWPPAGGVAGSKPRQDSPNLVATPGSVMQSSTSGYSPLPPGGFSGRVDAMGAMEGDSDHPVPGYYGQSSAATFMRQIRDIIEARVGQSPDLQNRKTAEGPAQSVAWPGAPINEEDYVLPTRGTADRLMRIYWFQVHTLYPFIDGPPFQKEYENMWTGEGTPSTPMFHCILNTAFAIACQLDDTIAPESRESSSAVFFNRAKQLLRFDILEAGSLDLVQALLLMGQYLQSTNSPARCWIVVGLGIRIAQSLGLYQDEATSMLPTQRDREMARRIWHGCVLMDR